MVDVLAPALVGGAVSLAVAGLSHWLGPRSQRSLAKLNAQLAVENERLKNSLDRGSDILRNEFLAKLEDIKREGADQNSARSARRDYEYEARKRLYTQVEPILFQLYEALEEAHYRVRSLARSSRSGNLGSGAQSWLARDGYYLRSTIYKLILPASYLRLMQRKITFVDLSLDSTIRLRYLLLKLYSRSFTDDFEFASLQPSLRYSPNAEGWQRLRQDHPQVYFRQALVVGDLETIADALIEKDGDTERVALFAEFEAMLDRHPGNDSLGELIELFRGFSQGEKPVLARMLVTQACLGLLILSTYHHKSDVPHLLVSLDELLRSDSSRNLFAWTEGAEGTTGDLQVAGQYIADRLAWLHKDGTWLESEGFTTAPASAGANPLSV